MADLRERNKRRTRVDIVRAALELFADQGYEDTTLPQIAHRAGVSPRTVSHYFPAKADIAIGPLDRILGRLEECLRDRPARATTVDALRTWLEGEAAIGDETGDNLVRRAMARNPALQARERERIVEAERLIASSVAKELGEAQDSVGPRLFAAAALAMTFELWGHKHVAHPDRRATHISQQADLIPTVVDLLRATRRRLSR